MVDSRQAAEATEMLKKFAIEWANATTSEDDVAMDGDDGDMDQQLVGTKVHDKSPYRF